jgi:ATP-binding cassette subfamily C protein
MWSQVRRCVALMAPPLRGRWLSLLPLILLASVFEATGTAAIFGLVRVIAEPDTINSIPPLAEMAARLPHQGPRDLVVWFTCMVALFYLAKNAVVAAAEYARARTIGETTAALAARLMEGYLRAPYSFHLRNNSARLIHNLAGGVTHQYGISLAALTQILTEGLVLLGIVVVLLVAAPQVTLVAGGTLALVSLIFVRATRRVVVEHGHRAHTVASAVLQAQQQALGAIKEIKVLGRTDFFAEAHAGDVLELARLRYLDVLFQALPRIIVETVFVCGALSVILVITLRGSSGPQTVSLLGLYAYAGFRIIPSTNRVLWQTTALRHARGALEQVHQDFFRVFPHGWADEVKAAPGAPLELADRISVEAVSFAYDDTQRPAVDGVSLEIYRGEEVGVVGTTGSGKSTLVDLLVGLLEPTAGAVRVDGCDLRGRADAWQAHIGYVPQSIVLVDGSVRENIALGIAAAAVDETRLAAVTRLAQLDELIATLPQGLATLVGERGVRLSGGERQRIGIARALYREPSVLVFDEATSALDNRTEAEVMRGIDELRTTKTIILIAHRLSTVRNCDRIFFLRAGRLVGVGSYDQLLADNAEFRALAT